MRQKTRLLTLLALLLTAATGAWAQEPATTYSVKMKAGTVDADKWTITPTEATTTGIPENTEVTLQYNGRLKVKGVKATSDAAAASVPDGALSGVFSVSSTKKVYFSKGNLRYASSKWSFFDNQYDYYDSYSEEAEVWDKFGWSTSAPTYGMNTTTSLSEYSGDFVDWGATMGAGWFTLSSDEWTYLINTRTTGGTVFGTSSARYAHATINTDGTGVNGMILFPDGVDIASTEVTTAGSVNATSAYATKCTTAQWSALAAKGCVFLPAAGRRNGSSMDYAGSRSYYWSATPNGNYTAYQVSFFSDNLTPANSSTRFLGCSVRLVREVATTDAEPAEATYTLLSAATTADCGKVVCAAGHLHDAKTAVPDGCTAVGVLGKVTETGHGLILALKDATEQTWNTINGWTSVNTYAGTTLKVLPDAAARSNRLTSYTTLGTTTVSNWAVAQKSDYVAIFQNLGSTINADGYTYDGNVNAYITTGVGGTAISGTYWSATESDDDNAWYFSSYWYHTYKTASYSVRPVLGF